MQRIDGAQRRARLARRQLLARELRATDVDAVAAALVALHASDPVTVYLSIQARTAGVTTVAIHDALYERRTLVRMLGMRRTLFVVPRALAPVVQASTTDAIAAAERRRLLGYVAASDVADAETWLTDASALALDVVRGRGEASSSTVADSHPELARPLRVGPGSRWEVTQRAATRVLPLLAMEGRLVRARPRGTWISGQFSWTTPDRWLGATPEPLDPAAARAALLGTWLGRFGPATERDVRWWTGWGARDARTALAAAGAEVVDLGGVVGYVAAGDAFDVAEPPPSAALLPSLDPTTMGWKERAWYLGPHGPALFDANGNAGPTVWWEGRVVGGWAQRADGEVAFRVLEDVGAEATRAIETEAERLRTWLGDVRFAPRFPTPL